MEASSGSSLTHVHKSQKVYFVYYENHFLVLPDGKTIIGVENKDSKKLFMEDITRNDTSAYRQIATHGNTIYSVLYNPVSKTLFVGDGNGRVVQYQKGANQETWTMVKDYGDLGIGSILSVDQIGDVVVFGGPNTYSIRAINSVTMTLLPGTLKTAIRNVYSLRFCELPENKVYLSVCGQSPSYSNTQTDIYDATELAKAFGYHFQGRITVPPISTTPSEESLNEEPIEKSPCGCNTKRVIDNFLIRFSEYFQDFRRVISSDFESKLKDILSSSTGLI
jgi:WD40 repeat protein